MRVHAFTQQSVKIETTNCLALNGVGVTSGPNMNYVKTAFV